MTERTDELLPCPICGGRPDGYTIESGCKMVSCRDGATPNETRCDMAYARLPRAVWQSLPRQSDELRGIVGEMDGAIKLGEVSRDAFFVNGWKDRLSRIADKGECRGCGGSGVIAKGTYQEERCDCPDSRPAPPAEVWVHCRENGQCGSKVIAVTVDGEHAARDTPGTWHGPIPVQGAPQDAGETCGECRTVPCNCPEYEPCAECEKPEQRESLNEAVRQKHGHYYAVANDLGEDLDAAHARIESLNERIKYLESIVDRESDAIGEMDRLNEARKRLLNDLAESNRGWSNCEDSARQLQEDVITATRKTIAAEAAISTLKAAMIDNGLMASRYLRACKRMHKEWKRAAYESRACEFGDCVPVEQLDAARAELSDAITDAAHLQLERDDAQAEVDAAHGRISELEALAHIKATLKGMKP